MQFLQQKTFTNSWSIFHHFEEVLIDPWIRDELKILHEVGLVILDIVATSPTSDVVEVIVGVLQGRGHFRGSLDCPFDQGSH